MEPNYKNLTLADAEKLLLNTIVNNEAKTLEQRISEDYIFEEKPKKTKKNTRKRKSSHHSSKKKRRKKKRLSRRNQRKRSDVP